MALQFDKRASRFRALEPLVHTLVDGLHLKEDNRVLDIGTGTGRFGLLLYDNLSRGSVVGVDSGRGMLKLAREKTLRGVSITTGWCGAKPSHCPSCHKSSIRSA